jgi:hypothetical protein
MSARRIVATFLILSMVAGGSPGLTRRAGAQSAPPAPPDAGQTTAPSSDVTPARVSYLNGEVSFWRPGAQDWTPATLNTPLAPGDILYAGPDGNVEIQIGPQAFARATNNTQIGLDNQEADFVQLRMTGGQAALDLRQRSGRFTVELDTPNAAFTIERTGYYRVDVAQDATAFETHRGGSAVVTPAGAAASPIAADQQVVLTGTDSPQIAVGAAAQLTAWDNWNLQRTDYLVQPASLRYVSQNMYGTEALDQYGNWRTVETYGAVWVPARVPAGWVPYSTGRWIWDPRFGWTWLDDAPWGWAPYHYGRWVFVGDYWAWAPGPVVVRPVYAPALVVFLGGVTVSVGRPLCWAPLAWGEPLIPWWGRPGFVGVPSWRGWGGPRVVNNVVIDRSTTVNVTNITVYKNVTVNRAVVGVPAERFGHGEVRPTRIAQAELNQLRPVRGPLEVKPVAASVMPAIGHAVKPPAAIVERPVVATRPPHDVAPTLRAHGLTPTQTPIAPRLVPPPKPVAVPALGPVGPRPEGQGPERRGKVLERATVPGSPREATPPPPNVTGPEQRRDRSLERPAPPPAGSPREATPSVPTVPGAEQRRGRALERPTPPPPSGSPGEATPAPRPMPEPRRGPTAERPPAPPSQPRDAAPPAPRVTGPEPRRGAPGERPMPPAPPGPPKEIAPPGPPRSTAPERRQAPAVERPAPPSVPAPGSPREGRPPGPSATNREQRHRPPAAERQTPPTPGPVAPPASSPIGPEQRRGPAVERPVPAASHQAAAGVISRGEARGPQATLAPGERPARMESHARADQRPDRREQRPER